MHQKSFAVLDEKLSESEEDSLEHKQAISGTIL